ncbi:MAG: M20/M25/M40 family metallo-hydrolase [Microscillaceae bacterium]|jgi:Zn-dependent M28 family amino/carboxypeptidase|nr:M20/M25/M40 family metallo-hydrolase [Microscillaceae bacterium]
MKHFYFLMLIFICLNQGNAQSETDSVLLRKIYNLALSEPKGYEWLEYLCYKVGARLSGSPQAQQAVEFTKKIMDTLQLDRVYLQEVQVPNWKRGDQEIGRITTTKKQKIAVRVVALGNAVGTGKKGIEAPIIEVKSLKELATLGKEKIQGKIVFFNRPMDVTKIRTSEAYGGAGDQRRSGPSEAAKYGAVGVVVRSLTTSIDNFPHTGALAYQLNVAQIPAVAISTQGADLLSQMLQKEPNLRFYFRTTCEMLPDAVSYNVIGEIKGSEKPEEIIVVGGHLDSWDLAQGAHDDGTGCVQSIDVLRLIKALGIKPKRTIRAVMFMNEENGLRGGIKYAEIAQQNQEKHIAALESDGGGFTPRGLGIGDETAFAIINQRWAKLFAPYMVEIQNQGGGADISPLRNQGVPLMSLNVDSQRYFDYHHTEIDTFDKVNLRELQLGAAAMAGLVYLIAEYGL